jgi:diguanylate cyclase (GGDEF)-like protein
MGTGCIYVQHNGVGGRAVPKATQIKDVRLRADKDGCLSAPAFAGALTAVWKETRERPEQQVTLLLLDIDNLHQLNTAHGRDAGDRAIAAAVGELARAAKREGWTLGRIGGDEFALLAPGVTVEAAFLRADALRRDIDAAFARALAKSQRCGVSIGVANIPRDARGPDDLMRKADLALYAAKEQGGDTVGLTPAEDMVLKSSYYSSAQLARLKALAERKKTKEAVLLREALEDVLRKYDRE